MRNLVESISKMILRKFISVILISLFLNFFTFSVLANESSQSALVKVKDVSTIVDRLKEKIALFFAFSKVQKNEIYKNLLEKRLADVEYVFEDNRGDLIETTTSRYWAQIGRTKDFVLKNKQSLISGENKKDINIEEWRGILERHILVINHLRDIIGYESPFWLLLSHDFNVLDNFRQSL